jgi:hypothetical protein
MMARMDADLSRVRPHDATGTRVPFDEGEAAPHPPGAGARLPDRAVDGFAPDPAGTGRPPLTFAFHEGDTVGGHLVRNVLVKQVGLTEDEAKEVIRGA